MTTNLRPCPACGEGGESYEVDLGGVTEIRCLRCGLPLDKWDEGSRARFRRVLLADDSDFFLRGLEDMLRTKGLAGEVTAGRDGAEAVHLATAALRDRRGFGLFILDLLMPRLNGFHTAVALRAVEGGFSAARAPILFLSSRRIDPGLHPMLVELAPAYYLNKGSSSGALLDDRLEKVLRTVWTAERRREPRV